MSDKAKVSNVVLKKVPEGKTPEHYTWKKVLEKEWAGEWTLAKLTGYRYKLGLDPSFVEELPEYKRGQLHWYEWLLCENGGIISLYDEKNRIGQIWTTQQTGEKVVKGIPGVYLHLTSDERLAHVVHFPLDKIVEVCELAGARKARQVSAAQKERLRQRALERGGFPPRSKPSPMGRQGMEKGEQWSVRPPCQRGQG